jgi:hypothetical protein
MATRAKEGFAVTCLDHLKRLVIVENLVRGIRYEFPFQFKHLKGAQIFDNYLLVMESKDGRRKMILLLE